MSGLLERAGLNRPHVDTGHHVVDILMKAAKHDETAADARELFGLLVLKVADAVEILRTFKEDDEARQAALAVLTGVSTERAA